MDFFKQGFFLLKKNLNLKSNAGGAHPKTSNGAKKWAIYTCCGDLNARFNVHS